MARLGVAPQPTCGPEPPGAPKGGKREAGPLQELLDVPLREIEPTPDRRGGESGICKPPHDFPNDCLQARRSNATVNAGANEIALRIENIRQQFPQMPISERRNRRGKPAYGRYERDEIRLQNESCGSVDGDRLVEPALGVRSDAPRGLAAEPQRGAAKTMGGARVRDLIERVDNRLSRSDPRLDGGSVRFNAFPPWERKDERVIAVADEFGRAFNNARRRAPLDDRDV